ncbi:hypothetical protein MRX96_033301 [Rhipicephalus microplus]
MTVSLAKQKKKMESPADFTSVAETTTSSSEFEEVVSPRTREFERRRKTSVVHIQIRSETQHEMEQFCHENLTASLAIGRSMADETKSMGGTRVAMERRVRKEDSMETDILNKMGEMGAVLIRRTQAKALQKGAAPKPEAPID